eukprot:TRINITY_DN573_c0_g2_i1.p2 TRINITY_DN573_c0_g2~~TRINITY_DN573_c0_g2_i1.p2  ORF type:complete len:77 (-),score=1.62 TRINITY_DN573_c0_g2_i1:81-311(-)
MSKSSMVSRKKGILRENVRDFASNRIGLCNTPHNNFQEAHAPHLKARYMILVFFSFQKTINNNKRLQTPSSRYDTW